MKGATVTGLIDSHCHLDHYADEELPALLTAAKDAGVSGVVTIGTRLANADEQKRLTGFATPDVRVWCTVGTHPDHVDEAPVPSVEEIISRADAPCVIGIGESGLDYFHGMPEVRPRQQESFRQHIGAARALNVPIVIHARQADDDVAQILREETEKGAFPILLHCFASGMDLARCVVELGGYVSFSGIATFPKCGEFRDAARHLPADRILVETDAPYLAPMPYRGKRNEPSYVACTAACLAQERGQELAEFIEMTTGNFFRLFRKAA
ncbi:TatD family hydrolase [Acetobacter farinalis]|uniref:TatD family hydrolase n=1 Tax=Acetobacter farinalis TaxID=1260984 RepID=A0ABT3Q4X5_9PROT|nr:TatD family hydrolase [Acetobacter farinalis]MCX2560331.1 TatD family hydrolase [Acetobacter farinalis]NHO28986.1 YchF/TatD family DNA exonuclease [Acetobacter farinalis]